MSGTYLKSARDGSIRSGLFLSVVSTLAAVQMLYQAMLPGPYYDEAAHAVYATWILTGREVLWGPPFVYWFLGVPVLGSTGYYAGPLESYLMLSSFYFFGINAFAMRIVPIAFATATLPFVYFFMKNRVGKASAYATTLILAFQPSFLLWSRVGLYPFSILIFLICSSLYCFDRWFSNKRILGLVVGFFLLGLGIQTFISFTWYIAALFVATIGMKINTGIRKREIPLVIASFLLGVGPYLLPWLSGDNIQFFVQNARISLAGVNNLMYVDNLFARLNHIGILIDGSGFLFYGGIHSDPLAIPLFVASFLGTLSLLIVSKIGKKTTPKGSLLLVAIFVTMLLQTPVTISSLNALHVLPLLPFTIMIVGSFLGSLWDTCTVMFRKVRSPSSRHLPRLCKAIVLLVLSLSVVLSLCVTSSYQMDLSRTGGEGPWTDAIYDAAHYLVAADCRYVLAVDWGFSYGLLVASSGKLNVRDIFWLQGEDFKKEVEYYARLGNTFFVSWRAPTSLAQMQLLRLTLAERGQSLILEKTLYQADGTLSIDLYTTTTSALGAPITAGNETRTVSCFRRNVLDLAWGDVLEYA